MELEEIRAKEIEFSRNVAIISFVWIAVTLGAGTLLVVYRDAFAGLFF